MQGCNRRRLTAQGRGEPLHCGVPAVPVASARQDSSRAYMKVWTLNPRGAPQLSLPFPCLLGSPHSFKTLPQVILFHMKCFVRKTGRSKWSSRTAAHPERSPAVSPTLALWPYTICNTRQFCTSAEQPDMKRNRERGDWCYRH